MERVVVGDIALVTASLTPQDREYIDPMPSAKRRAELTAWRSLLRTTLRDMGFAESVVGSPIEYSDTGAPHLVGCEGIYIGVSHNASRVAIIISTTEPCAIDIEDTRRDFRRVARKYTTAEEVALFGDERDALPVIWCAKESLIKLAPTRELDLLRDLKIISATERSVTASCLGREYTLTYYRDAEDMIVYR